MTQKETKMLLIIAIGFFAFICLLPIAKKADSYVDKKIEKINETKKSELTTIEMFDTVLVTDVKDVLLFNKESCSVYINGKIASERLCDYRKYVRKLMLNYETEIDASKPNTFMPLFDAIYSAGRNYDVNVSSILLVLDKQKNGPKQIEMKYSY